MITIDKLKEEMDERLTGIENKMGTLSDDLKELKIILVGGGLKKDGGMAEEIDNMKKKVNDLENFKNKTLVIWAVITAAFAAFTVLASLAIAYFKK